MATINTKASQPAHGRPVHTGGASVIAGQHSRRAAGTVVRSISSASSSHYWRCRRFRCLPRQYSRSNLPFGRAIVGDAEAVVASYREVVHRQGIALIAEFGTAVARASDNAQTLQHHVGATHAALTVPDGSLGRCSPTRSGRKSGLVVRMRARSSVQAIHAAYCRLAEATSARQPWLMMKTSVLGRSAKALTMCRLIKPMQFGVTANAQLRNAPDRLAPVVARLPKETVVERAGKWNRRWMPGRHEPTLGWVGERLLEKVGEPEPHGGQLTTETMPLDR
jgi:hypothetical protein